MKVLTCFLIVLLLNCALFAGDWDRVGIPIIIYENGFSPSGTRFWASGGAGLADPNNVEVLLYNPAHQTINDNKILMGGMKQFSHTFYKNETSEMKLGSKWLIPSYLLFSHRFTFGQLFLGYQTVYNFKKESKLEVATLEHPEGTGEYVTDYEDQTLQNFFIGFSRSVLRALDFGIKVGLLRHHFTGKMHKTEIKSDAAYSYALNLGLNYKANDFFHTALVFQYFEPMEFKTHLEAPFYVDSTADYEYVMIEVTRDFRLPWMLDLGFYFKPSHFLQFMFKIEYQEWENISKYYENRLQLAFGTRLHHENWQFSAGAFTCGKFPTNKNGLEDTPFLTAGMSYQIKPGILISMSAVSNGIFSKKIDSKFNQIERSQILFGLEWGL